MLNEVRCPFFLAVLLAVLSWPVAAQTYCTDDRKAIIDQLERLYSERRVSIGLDYGGHVIEVFVAPDGSWTMLETFPNGRTCMIVSGEAWEQIIPVEGKGT